VHGVAERLTIDHVGQRGDGISLPGGAPLFVPYTLGGETVDTEIDDGHPERRRLLGIEIASPERIDPFCTYFTRCGGCAIQHWQPDPYRGWKRQIVVDTLVQAKIVCTVDPVIDAHGAGRRRVTLHARRGNDGELRVGFAAAASHAIIAIDDCPILDPALDGALGVARALAEVLKPVSKPLDIQVTAASNGLDVDVRGTGPVPTAIISSLSRVAEQHRLARLTRHGELVLMRTPPVITMGKAQVALPPGSFLQATGAGEETLAALVLKLCKGSKTIADLFCGIGPFALRLA
jgi:23S rRNA (uracil1939-C5)-methyltransferase